MLASRVLPPIVRTSSSSPSLPVATFFNVPRRYVRSTMQTEHHSAESPIDGAKPSRTLRKSSRIHDARSTSICSLTTEHNIEEPASADTLSPQISRKRLASLMEGSGSEDSDSLVDDKPPSSAMATAVGPPDFAGHVCLCQPEPKIPRPRNGEFAISLCPMKTSFPIRLV